MGVAAGMLTSALMTTGGSVSEARKGDESFFFDFLSAFVRLKRMVGMVVGAEMLLLKGLGLLLTKFLRNCVHFESGGALLKNSVIFSCFRSDSLDGSITEFLSLTNLKVSELKRAEDACLSRLILGE